MKKLLDPMGCYCRLPFRFVGLNGAQCANTTADGTQNSVFLLKNPISPNWSASAARKTDQKTLKSSHTLERAVVYHPSNFQLNLIVFRDLRAVRNLVMLSTLL